MRAEKSEIVKCKNPQMATAISISKTLTNLRGGGGSISSIPKHWWVQSYVFSTINESPSTSSTQTQSQETKKGRWSKLFLFLPGAITFCLGTWQIFRRREKIAMLEYRQKRLEMEPVKWIEVSPSSKKMDSLEFRRIICKGVFDEDRSIYVGPRSRSISGVTENGYYLITPLMPVRDDHESVQFPILVNRGWVPRSWRDKSIEVSKDGVQPSNIGSHPKQEIGSAWWKFWSKKPEFVEDQAVAVTPVEVVGVVRESENPSIFVPANEPSSFQWFYVDVPAIACAAGLPEDTIFVEDVNENVNPSKPYPVPKDINTLISSSVMPQDHLNYMLTWYSLSAGVTYMAFKRLRPRKNWR